MKKNEKYYVVWEGKKNGIYNSWEECKEQIYGFSSAKYKSFKSLEEAQKAFNDNSETYIGKTLKGTLLTKEKEGEKPIENSISVDGACSGNPGIAEYQGVYTCTATPIFHAGPFKDTSNNIVEFLAIVHALAYCKKNNISIPIYSDSKIAIFWVDNKKCSSIIKRTKNNNKVFELITRAENWLENNEYENKILKWNTKEWGEIPADFGRK